MALELLTPAETRSLQSLAERLWRDLQANQLGGYSDGNRPFFIRDAFREVIEKFGRRDTGWTWTPQQIAAESERLRPLASCRCPAGRGEACPLSTDECLARAQANTPPPNPAP